MTRSWQTGFGRRSSPSLAEICILADSFILHCMRNDHALCYGFALQANTFCPDGHCVVLMVRCVEMLMYAEAKSVVDGDRCGYAEWTFLLKLAKRCGHTEQPSYYCLATSCANFDEDEKVVLERACCHVDCLIAFAVNSFTASDTQLSRLSDILPATSPVLKLEFPFPTDPLFIQNSFRLWRRSRCSR